MDNKSLCIIVPAEHIEEAKDIAFAWAQSIGMTDPRERLMEIGLAFNEDDEPTHYFCNMVEQPIVLMSVELAIMNASNSYAIASPKTRTLTDTLMVLKGQFCCVYASKEDFLKRVGLVEVN